MRLERRVLRKGTTSGSRNTVGYLEKDPGPGNDGFWKPEAN